MGEVDRIEVVGYARRKRRQRMAAAFWYAAQKALEESQPDPIADTFLGKQSTADTASIVGNSITFADMDAGAADSRKRLLILAAHNGGATQHEGFAGTGLTFTSLFDFSTADDTNNANCLSGWIADIPDGGTLTGLQLQCNAAAVPLRGHASFYVIGRPGAPLVTIKTFAASADSLTGTSDVEAGGALLGIATTTTDLNSCDWGSGLDAVDSNYKVAATWHVSTARYSNTGGAEVGRTITADWAVNPSSNLRMAVVAFGART